MGLGCRVWGNEGVDPCSGPYTTPNNNAVSTFLSSHVHSSLQNLFCPFHVLFTCLFDSLSLGVTSLNFSPYKAVI